MAAGTAAVILLLLGLPPWLVDQAHGRLADTDRVRAITEERRTVLAVFAAVGAAITLWYTHQRQEPDRDANRTDRYTKPLSNSATRPNPPSNWAACTPERAAHDSIRDRRVSFDVLSAFVRQQAQLVQQHSDAPLTNRRRPNRACRRVDRFDHSESLPWRATLGAGPRGARRSRPATAATSPRAHGQALRHQR